MTKNGCFNRAPLHKSAWVQSGWTDIQDDFGYSSRMPIMIKIVVPMTLTCQYQKLKKDDIGCVNCSELEL